MAEARTGLASVAGPEPRDGIGPRRRRIAWAASLAAAALVLLSVAPLLLSGGGVLAHVACQLGPAVAHATVFTPVLILLAPPAGSILGWWNTSTESWSMSIANGSGAALYLALHWSLYHPSTKIVLGSAGAQVCEGGDVAIAGEGASEPTDAVAACTFQPEGTTSDLNTSLNSSAPYCGSVGTASAAWTSVAFRPCLPLNASCRWFNVGAGTTVTHVRSLPGIEVSVPFVGATSTHWATGVTPGTVSTVARLGSPGCIGYESFGSAGTSDPDYGFATWSAWYPNGCPIH